MPFFASPEQLDGWMKLQSTEQLREKYVFFRRDKKTNDVYACWKQLERPDGSSTKLGWVPSKYLHRLYSDVLPIRILQDAATNNETSNLDVRYLKQMKIRSVDPPHSSKLSGTLQGAVSANSKVCSVMTMTAQRNDFKARSQAQKSKGVASLDKGKRYHPAYSDIVLHRLMAARMLGSWNGGPGANERIEALSKEILCAEGGPKREGGRVSKEKAVLRALCEVLFVEETPALLSDRIIIQFGTTEMMTVLWTVQDRMPYNLSYTRFVPDDASVGLWRQARENSGSKHTFRRDNLSKVVGIVGDENTTRDEALYKALRQGIVASDPYKANVALIWTFLDYVFPPFESRGPQEEE